MPDEKTPLTVHIDPEALRELEQQMDPVELQSFLDKIKAAFESGEAFENAEPIDIDQLREDDPELYEKIVSRSTEIYEHDKKVN